jgi:hypothetical protein
MLVIGKKDYPKDLNPLGLKRGDVIQLEVADATTDFITVDPATLKLLTVRDAAEPRDPIIKEPKPKKMDTLATMPLPDLKMALQNPPMPGPVEKPALPPMSL